MKPDTRSTDTFAQGTTFRPHGRLEMRIEGSIAYADAYGPFNVEFIQAVALTLRDVRSSTELPRPYANIVQFHVSLMGSKEMLDLLSSTIGQIRGEDVGTALAFVVAPEVEGRDLMLPLFERVFREHGRNFRSFDNGPEAEAWVHDCLEAARG